MDPERSFRGPLRRAVGQTAQHPPGQTSPPCPAKRHTSISLRQDLPCHQGRLRAAVDPMSPGGEKLPGGVSEGGDEEGSVYISILVCGHCCSQQSHSMALYVTPRPYPRLKVMGVSIYFQVEKDGITIIKINLKNTAKGPHLSRVCVERDCSNEM